MSPRKRERKKDPIISPYGSAATVFNHPGVSRGEGTVLQVAGEPQVLASGIGWVVVEKPWGMSVHNDPGSDLISLVSAMLSGPPAAAISTGSAACIPVQPVHRLDRETSGVILLATDPDCLRFLSREFQENRVHKTYVALVHGCVLDGEPEGASGAWTWALSREAGGRTDPGGRGRRVPSETRFRVIRRSGHYSLLEITLITGRKHQIRRHAALAGHPVTGDARYGSKRANAWLSSNRGYLRLGLHSFSLTFSPPDGTGEVTVASPGIPPEMIRLMETDD